jgi:hypothetical protein
MIKHGRPPLWVVTRCHLTHGLVIAEDLGALHGWMERRIRVDGRERRRELNSLTIQAHIITGANAGPKLSGRAVHGHTPVPNPLLDPAARTQTQGGQHFLQSLRLHQARMITVGYGSIALASHAARCVYLCFAVNTDAGPLIRLAGQH